MKTNLTALVGGPGGVKSVPLTDEAAFNKLFSLSDDGPISLQRAYAYQGWLRRCVKFRAGAVASVPFTISTSAGQVLYDSEERGRMPDELAWAADLKPCLFKLDASFILAARAYLFKVMERGQLTELRYLAPQTVKEILSPTEGVVAYERWINGMRAGTLEREDVVAIYEADPWTEAGPARSSTSGEDAPSDAGAAREHADVLYQLTGYASNHLRRDLVQTTVFTTTDGARLDDLPEEGTSAFNALGDKLRRLLGARRKDYDPILLENIEPKSIGEGFAGLGKVELTEEHRQAICNAVGPPYELMAQASNYATRAGAQRDFDERVVMPDGLLLESGLNQQLFWDRGLSFRFEFDRLNSFQDAQLSQVSAVVEAVREGILTRAEARMILGRPDAETDGEEPTEAAQQASADDAEKRHHELQNLRRLAAKADDPAAVVDAWQPEVLTRKELRTVSARLLAGETVAEATDDL